MCNNCTINLISVRHQRLTVFYCFPSRNLCKFVKRQVVFTLQECDVISVGGQVPVQLHEGEKCLNLRSSNVKADLYFTLTGFTNQSYACFVQNSRQNTAFSWEYCRHAGHLLETVRLQMNQWPNCSDMNNKRCKRKLNLSFSTSVLK